jgi:four helix bundle protein
VPVRSAKEPPPQTRAPDRGGRTPAGAADEPLQPKPPAPDLAVRLKQFALRVIKLSSSLPRSQAGQVIGRQVLRSGTSVGAHYREARRSRSNAEFVAKLGLALQELDETQYWFELVVEAGLMQPPRLHDLQTEADELISILTTCVKNVKRRESSAKA